LRGAVAISVGIASKLFSNLMVRCDSIAVAMTARGFRGPTAHELRAALPPATPAQRMRRVAADAALLLTLGALGYACTAVV
jgi:energy-coupling factor transporter transmembrane protein EcfT